MFFVFTFLLLILGRANSSLLGFEVLNPDETQMIANAIGIASRNFNFLFFDGNSSGLLNSLILAWPKIFNLDITFLTTRLTAIILLSLIILFTYKISKYYLNSRLSFLLCCPLILIFAFTKDPDFLHYSSELLSTFILTISYWIFIKNIEKKNNFFYIAPLLLSLIFISKIQFGPVAFIFFSVILFEQYHKNKFDKNFMILILSFVSLPIIFLFFHYLNNTLRDFIINYIQYPKDYITVMNPIDGDDVSIKLKSKYLKHLLYNSTLHYFYIYFIFFIFISIRYFNIGKIKKLFNRDLIINLILIVSAIICILIPGRNFRHYLILLMPFIPIFFSILINILMSKKQEINKVLSNIFSASIVFIVFSLFFENEKFYSKSFLHTEFKINNINFKNPEIFNFLKTSKQEKIYIWGWMPKWYVLSGLQPASRSTISEKLIEKNNYKNYYRKRLIKDISFDKPNLIIDFIREKSFKNNLVEDKIDYFIELNNIVKKDYIQLQSENKTCPSYYLIKKSLIEFNKKNINFYFNKDKFIKMNDFSVTEDICDDKYNFPSTDESQFIIYFKEKEKIQEVLILSSKLNYKNNFVNLKFLNKKKVIYEKKVYIKQYPYWTSLKLSKNLIATSIIFDVENLKINNSGINEIKIFRN